VGDGDEKKARSRGELSAAATAAACERGEENEGRGQEENSRKQTDSERNEKKIKRFTGFAEV
jgi:hypothetical protein